MQIWKFEGTAEEFAGVAQYLVPQQKQKVIDAPEAAMVQSLKLDDQETRFVTEEEASHILNRLQLSENMKRMLLVLFRAEGRTLSEDIREELGLTSDQFRGLTGAFGRRVANSVPDRVRFFDAQWEPTSNQFSWLLPQSVKTVLSKDERFNGL